MMSSEIETTKKRHWVSEGMLIAALPAFSYAIAYAYESGIAKHYGISTQLIEITLTGTLIAFGYLFSSIFIVWILAEAFNPLWIKLPDSIRRRLKLYNGFLVFFIGYILIAGESLTKLKFLWIILGLMLFFDFILPAFAFRDKKSYVDRIQNIHDRNLRYDSVLDKIAARIGISWIMVGLLIIFALSLSYYNGVGNARRQLEYLVLVGNTDEIILRQYNDTIVSAPIDRTAKQIFRIYTVQKISTAKYISFRPENIGPLVLKEDSVGANFVSAEKEKSVVIPNKSLKRDEPKVAHP